MTFHDWYQRVGKHCMKTSHTLIIGLFALLISCGRSEPSKIEFEGQTFELPLKVENAKKILKLQYAYYSGFYNADENGISIKTQLADYPLFMGNDNDNEESYYDSYFAGVTFFKAGKTIDQLKNDFEKQYNKEFRTEIKNIGETGTSTPIILKYHYIRTDEGIFIALKETVQKPGAKKFISVSFYKGIAETEIAKYLEFAD